MHALPLAAPDLSAALPATVPAAAGVAPDDRFSTHLWAAAGARPGQPVQNAVPARDAEGAAPGDPEALAPDGDALPVFSEDQDAAEAASPFDPSNLVAGLIAGWLPWQASAGAELVEVAAGRAASSTGAPTDTGSAMGRLLRPSSPAGKQTRARPASARWSWQRQSPPASNQGPTRSRRDRAGSCRRNPVAGPGAPARAHRGCAGRGSRGRSPRRGAVRRCPGSSCGRRRIAGTFSGRPESLPPLDVTAGCSARRGREPRCRLAPSGLINDRCPADPGRPGRAPRRPGRRPAAGICHPAWYGPPGARSDGQRTPPRPDCPPGAGNADRGRSHRPDRCSHTLVRHRPAGPPGRGRPRHPLTPARRSPGQRAW